VEVTAYPDPLAAWAAFLGGEADVAEIPRDALPAAVDVASGRLLPYLAERGVRLHRDPRLEIFYDAFNAEDPVLGRPAGERGLALRRAICLAVDDDWTMTRLYTNHSERVQGPLLPEMRGYDPAFRNPWTRADDETREDAITLARETLAAAGMPEGRGVPVLRMHILDDPMSRQVFDIMRVQLAEIGLRVEPVPVAWPRMQEVLRAKQAQWWTSSWYADYPDAFTFLQLFHGPNGPEPNYANYRDAEFDELYREARLLPPGRDRDDLVRWMQRIVTDDCAWRFRFRRVRWAASQGWLSGYRHNDVVPKHFKYCRADEAARQRLLGPKDR
jgi:ABC-type transport system substrate-binding protein